MEPSKPVNPYQAPSVTEVRAAADEAAGSLIPNGQAVEAGRFIGWLTSAWELFIQSPLIWAVNALIFGVIYVVLQFIPFIGPLALNLLMPVFAAGFLIGADEQRRGNTLEVGHLFAGFQKNFGSLVILGLINLGLYFALAIVIVILMMITMGASGLMGSLMSGGGSALGANMMAGGLGIGLLILLVGLAMFIPIAMAAWFAPALVVFHDMQPIAAMVMSFKGCLKNLIPLIASAIIFVVLIIIGMIPIFLGLLVVLPLFYASMYASYREIFVANADQAA
jgi:uncharacterized membrane protein